MRWRSKGFRRPNTWYRWFAWYPVEITSDIYTDGHWIWLETIYKSDDSYYGPTYSMTKPSSAQR